MRRLSPLDEPNSDDDTVGQDVRRLAAFMCLVLGLAEELGLDLLGAFDLQGRRKVRRGCMAAKADIRVYKGALRN